MKIWIAALLLAASAGAHARMEGPAAAREDGAEHEEYACPMHPGVRSDKPGKCPKCGMTLRPVAGDDEHAGHAMNGERAGNAMSHATPHGREGSGTSWLPDSTPVFAHHFMSGEWMLMLHYSAIIGYDDQWSDRGSRALVSTNWLMAMASHPLLGGTVTFRTMLSAEPLTAGTSRQIPLLLQSGETYGGVPLHDRQHPHDFFMEVAAMYRRELAGGAGFELYAAPSGEPALGPSAFMHRMSAMMNPFPPVSHHWQDSTHISFPVLTAGITSARVKLEASTFHGREPDEDRWDFDLGALDSWSVRLSANPTASTSFQVSYGALHSPETLEPGEDLQRVTASAAWNPGGLALTAVWGRNIAHESSDSFLLEAQADLDGRNVPFARLELVEKLGHDLVLPGERYRVGSAVLGYARRLPAIGPVVPAIGAAVNVGVVPADAESAYGTRTPFGAYVFVGVQPPKGSM